MHCPSYGENIHEQSVKEYKLQDFVGIVHAANWDGIYDNETGILTYTWAVGTSPCGDDIVTHNDPHEHIASASEWTNVGLAFGLNLPGNVHELNKRDATV